MTPPGALQTADLTMYAMKNARAKAPENMARR